MEVDDIQIQTHVSKFQKVSSNGTTATSNNDVNTSSNQQKLAPSRANFQVQVRNHVHDSGPGVVGGGDGVARLCGWPSSRIVRVSRASGGKDRHSKVLTSKGLRDRRVRLSVSTAIQFYDLQDRLGFDQPSKAVEWLLKAAASSIDELPSLDPPFHGTISDCDREMKFTDRISQIQTGGGGDNNVSCVKSPVSSSTSETSRGSGLSLSRSENRIKARERAREMVSKKEKSDSSTRVTVLNQVNDNNSNNMSENNSTFTDLLTGGINRSPMDYFFNRTSQIQIPQFNINTEENIQHQQQQQQQNHHHYSFLQNSFIPQVPVTTTGGGVNSGGEGYNLSFAMSSSSAGGGGGAIVSGGFSRGTLQSNLQSSLLSNHHHLQRFQSSSIDGSTSPNLPFFVVQNTAVDHYPVTTELKVASIASSSPSQSLVMKMEK
ncbi:hypothetical protein QVD17_20712 [Tagetes erecta]|uniref:Uncharacterized protein n=1 Tax=Tagetes erecta TaxID=13708 RepID=A0AAD8KQB5_TARER|nr:hypothetical protein QVD17_20712 [Tagetes erecta]